MTDMGMLRDLQVLQNSTTGDDTIMQVLYAEAFQTLHLEMTEQFLACGLLGEYPVFQEEVEETVTEITLKVVLPTPLYQHLLRLEVVEELLYVVVGALTGQKLSGRDI